MSEEVKETAQEKWHREELENRIKYCKEHQKTCDNCDSFYCELKIKKEGVK